MSEIIENKPTETVSSVVKKEKKTRKFVWTDKRRAAFDKCVNANKARKEQKKIAETPKADPPAPALTPAPTPPQEPAPAKPQLRRRAIKEVVEESTDSESSEESEAPKRRRIRSSRHSVKSCKYRRNSRKNKYRDNVQSESSSISSETVSSIPTKSNFHFF